MFRRHHKVVSLDCHHEMNTANWSSILSHPDCGLDHVRELIFAFLQPDDLLALEHVSHGARHCVHDYKASFTYRLTRKSLTAVGSKKPLMCYTRNHSFKSMTSRRLFQLKKKTEIQLRGPIITRLIVNLGIEAKDEASLDITKLLLCQFASNITHMKLIFETTDSSQVDVKRILEWAVPQEFPNCAHLTLQTDIYLSDEDISTQYSNLLKRFPALVSLRCNTPVSTPRLDRLPNLTLLRTLHCKYSEKLSRTCQPDYFDSQPLDLSHVTSLVLDIDFNNFSAFPNIDWMSPLVKFSALESLEVRLTEPGCYFKKAFPIIFKLSNACSSTLRRLTIVKNNADDQDDLDLHCKLSSKMFDEALQEYLSQHTGEMLCFQELSVLDVNTVTLYKLLEFIGPNRLKSLEVNSRTTDYCLQGVLARLPPDHVHCIERFSFQNSSDDTTPLQITSQLINYFGSLKSLSVVIFHKLDATKDEQLTQPLAQINPSLVDSLLELTMLKPTYDPAMLLSFIKGLTALRTLKLMLPCQLLDNRSLYFPLASFVHYIRRSRSAHRLDSLKTVILQIDGADYTQKKLTAQFQTLQQDLTSGSYKDFIDWSMNGQDEVIFQFKHLP